MKDDKYIRNLVGKPEVNVHLAHLSIRESKVLSITFHETTEAE